jgi:hypothetical protein
LGLTNHFSFSAVSLMAAKLALCTLVTLFASTGCEKRVEPANIDVVNRQQTVAEKRASTVENVQEGLTMKEVEAVLGTPCAVKTGKLTLPVQKDFVLTTWTYRQDGQEVELSFIDGKLQGKAPRFGEVLESKAPLQMKNGKSNGPNGR